MLQRTILCSTFVFLAACSSDRGGGGGGGGGGNPPPPPRPIDAAAAIATANSNLRGIVGGTARAAAFADSSSVLKDIASGSTACTSPDPQGGSGTATCGTSLDFESDAGDFADEIAERALNVLNVETAQASAVTLLLDPQRACTAVRSGGGAAPPPGDPQPPMSTPDPDCVTAFTNTPVRLELTSRSEGDIDVALLIGAAKARTLTVSLHSDELVLEVDLGAAKSAAEALITAFGGDAEYLPAVLTGRVKLSVKKNAENDYSATFAILSPVRVTNTTASDPYDVEIAAAPEALTMRVDGNAQQITGATAFNAIRFDLPLDLFHSSTTNPVTGTMRISAAGATASTVVRASDDSVEINGVGAGNDSFRMTVDSQPYLSVDINAGAGRKADLVLRQVEEGLSVRASPKLDVGVSLDMRSIQNRVDGLASWMLDDDLRLAIEGSSPEVILKSISDSVSTGGGEAPPPPMPEAIAKVQAGMMTVSSRAGSRTITVPSGQCLIQLDMENASHPIQELSSGACP